MESLLLKETWGEPFKSIVGQSVHVTRPARALLRREHTRGRCCAWRDKCRLLRNLVGNFKFGLGRVVGILGVLGRIHQRAFKGDKHLSLFWRL